MRTIPKPEALLPCPICNGPATTNWQDGIMGGKQWFVYCFPDEGLHGCVRQDTTYATERQAITAWNTRHSNPVDEDYPECSGDPKDCPENEGYGCCPHPHIKLRETQAFEQFSKWRESQNGNIDQPHYEAYREGHREGYKSALQSIPRISEEGFVDLCLPICDPEIASEIWETLIARFPQLVTRKEE